MKMLYLLYIITKFKQAPCILSV